MKLFDIMTINWFWFPFIIMEYYTFPSCTFDALTSIVIIRGYLGARTVFRKMEGDLKVVQHAA